MKTLTYFIGNSITHGEIIHTVYDDGDGIHSSRLYGMRGNPFYYGGKKNLFATKEDAIAEAEKRKKKHIDSLKKQLQRLELMEFSFVQNDYAVNEYYKEIQAKGS